MSCVPNSQDRRYPSFGERVSRETYLCHSGILSTNPAIMSRSDCGLGR